MNVFFIVFQLTLLFARILSTNWS